MNNKQIITKRNVLTNYTTGTCMEMCPKDEITMRERERLLHVLEIFPGTEKHRKPQADPSKMVKSFARSAAGKIMLDAKHLRPPDVLLKTINYLLGEVIINDKINFRMTYDFIMDRLRSVRQDMVIQNSSRAHCISILQPIIRFHAYASYKLCEEKISNFDPHINKTHLQECLKRLLCIYDDCEHFFKDTDENIIMEKYLREYRPQFEALYLIMNLGDPIALTRGLNLKKCWRTNLVNLCIKMSMAFLQNNFVRTCKLMKKLPVLHLALASLHLPTLRRTSLKIMSTAYSSKNLSFPVEVLKNLLLFNSIEQVHKECKYYGLKCDNNAVHFMKTDFNENKTALPPVHLEFIDEQLKDCDLPILMLYGY